MRVSIDLAAFWNDKAQRMSVTVLDRLAELLAKAASGNSHTAATAVAVLWTDKERQWEGAIGQLRQAMPRLLTLGDFNIEQRSGPAIWLKCAIAGSLPAVQFEGVPEGGDDDDILIYRVTEIADDKVVLDGNHPLAGMALVFTCTVTSIRPASAEEIEHGHVHEDGDCEHDD